MAIVQDTSSPGIQVGGISGGVGNTIQIHAIGMPMFTFFTYEQIYDDNNKLVGRIDGKTAKLINDKWLMKDLLLTQKDEKPLFYPYYEYSTYLDKEDIKNSLSAPEMMSFMQLGNFINILEKLGYSANDYKIYYYNILLMPIVIVGFVILAFLFQSR